MRKGISEKFNALLCAAMCVLTVAAALCASAFAVGGSNAKGAPETSVSERARTEEPNANETVLTTVMYHNILKSIKGTYIVSPDQLESDLSAYKKLGYTYVFPSEIIGYVRGTNALPDKPLLITFDDGRYNNMYYGLPILEKYDAKALLCPVGAFSAFSTDSGDHSNPNYSHITWSQFGELAASGRFEIGNHTYNMHKYSPRFGVKRMKGESDSDYRAALKKDFGRLQDMLLKSTGVLPRVFAYPFGAYTDEAKDVLLSLGIEMMLTCNEGVTTVKRGVPESLHYVRRFNRDGLISTAEFTKKLNAAYERATDL